MPERPLEPSISTSMVAGPAPSLSVRNTHPAAASMLVHTASPLAPANDSTLRSPHTPNFDMPAETVFSFTASPNTLQRDGSLHVWPGVGTNALLVSSPSSRTNGSVHTPPTSTTKGPTSRDQQLNGDSPRVVFGPPPPRVLTMAPAEKPPVKKRRSRATVPHVRRSGNRKNGTATKTGYGCLPTFLL